MGEAVGRRRAWRPAAITTTVLLAGLLPAAASSADGDSGPLRLVYTCASALGTGVARVALGQAYPVAGAVGKPIQPGDLTAEIGLDRAALAALLPPGAGAGATAGATAGAGATVIGGRGRLTTRVTQGGSAVDADWAGLTAAAVGVGEDGGLALTFTGAVPPVTVSAPGEVVFTAGDLALDLDVRSGPVAGAGPVGAHPEPTSASTTVPTTASTVPPVSASTSVPAPAPAPASASTSASASGGAVPLALRCTLQPGRPGGLGTVAVPGGPPSASPGPGAPAPSGSPSPSGRGTPSGPVPGTAEPSAGSAAGPSSASPAPGSEPLAGRAEPPVAGGTIAVGGPVHSGVSECPPAPQGALDPNRLPKVPEGAIVLPMPGADPFDPVPACAFAVGYANVGKLGSAALINDPQRDPAMIRVDMHKRIVMLWTDDGSPGYVEVDGLGELELPPAEATFLTYGFMPTSARMKLTPLGPLTLTVIGNSDWDQPVITTAAGYQSLTLYDVRVNGTPLDVGPDCRTVAPIDLTLKGRQDSGISSDDGRPDYTVQTGGPLSADHLVIPPFTGCGTGGEDLSPLFTAAVSGAGNSLNFIQGALCTPTSDEPNGCTPEIEMPAPPHR
ncbi:hypothetical protein [Kitasatospora sp. NPDC057015]|uniref:hypothetical protein n=1 Tax=Kitasatospora sp. NPDC057015 TaxID=3346001 RepID=UPI003625B798